jgi:uncharacterized protein (TIGR03437 family)
MGVVRYWFVRLLLGAFVSHASAQLISPTPQCAVVDKDATYRKPPLTYPMTSDRYAVQYQLGGSGTWITAQVYISYYGGTNASPNRSSSGYVADTSMSFVSIPAAANTAVALRVTKLFGSGLLGSAFPAINQVSVRPQAKKIHVDSASGSLVQISTTTAANFAGAQFLLWWAGDSQQSSIIQSLVFFLNPPYVKPTGSNVKVIATPADLTANLSSFDTLDFEGTLAVASTGAQAFVVPANIANVFFGPGAWVQGKLRFVQAGNGSTRRIYGPGVLDVSRFEYDLRACDANSGYADQGYHAISLVDPPKKTVPDIFQLDGLVITDHNHAVADLLTGGAVNNVNTLGWNGLNGGFRIGDNTSVSNLFTRAGDDSLMMWGSFITVTNATVWQNYNGGVFNLGWDNNSPGDYSLVDGVYVVKTDWTTPTVPSWTATNLNGQNDAVIASLMVPGTMFGSVQPSLYRNIFVEDPPRTLLSLKITFPECIDPNQPRDNTCAPVDLTQPSLLNLNIENLFSPASIVQNSIGFQTLPPGFSDGTQTFPSAYTLTGSMNVGLSNVMLTLPNGTVTTLTSANAATVGNIGMNGGPVSLNFVAYTGTDPELLPAILPGGVAPATIQPGEWVSIFGNNLATSTATWSGDFPTSLGGASVTIDGKAAYLSYASPSQINLQAPYDTATGSVPVVVTTAAGVANSTATLAAFSPEFFLLDGTHVAGIILRSNGKGAYGGGTYDIIGPTGTSLGYATVAATAGDIVSLFGTGFGPTSPTVTPGQPFSGATPTVNPVKVKINSLNLTPLFAGLSGAGLYQLNLTIPAGLGTGDVSLQGVVGGVQTPSGVVISLQ